MTRTHRGRRSHEVVRRAGDMAAGPGARAGGVTCAAVVPWLVRTARSVGRRSRAEATSGSCGEAAREPATSAWSALPTASRYGVLLLAVVLFLVALALAPPAWRAVLGVVLWLVVLPLGLLRLRARAEQRAPRCDALDSATRPQPPNRI